MNKYIKNKYNVKKDSMEWALIKSSVFIVEDERKKQAELEMIDSYIYCMKKICDSMKREFMEGIHVIKFYSLCIPYLFICRHSLELILKKSIENNTNKVKKGHNILKLWNECKGNNEKLDYYDELINTVNLLDDDGLRFRYAKDIEGNVYNDPTFFLNIEKLKDDIIKLKEELEKY